MQCSSGRSREWKTTQQQHKRSSTSAAAHAAWLLFYVSFEGDLEAIAALFKVRWRIKKVHPRRMDTEIATHEASDGHAGNERPASGELPLYETAGVPQTQAT